MCSSNLQKGVSALFPDENGGERPGLYYSRVVVVKLFVADLTVPVAVVVGDNLLHLHTSPPIYGHATGYNIYTQCLWKILCVCILDTSNDIDNEHVDMSFESASEGRPLSAGGVQRSKQV